MSSATPATNPSATIGLAWALLGVLAFSFTFPMTHIALQGFDALFIGVGRGALSGIGAILLLWISRSPWPTRQQWPPLLVIVIGVCVGFPVFSAYALTEMPAGHAGIITGVMPLATALFALRRSHDKPKTAFWMAALLGSLGVISFEIWRNGLDMQLSSLWMLLAVILGAAGYAEGAHLTKDMGGWRVISWALAISCLPLSILSLYLLPTELPTQTSTWLAFAYVALISQWLGFFPWYKGLAQAGIARAAQMQLLMPFFTLLTAWWLIDEALQAVSLWFALWVSLAVALAQRAHRPAASNSSGKPAGKRLLKALLLSLLVLACSACRVDHPQPAEPPGCSGCP